MQKKIYKSYRHLRSFVNAFMDRELALHASSLSFYTIFTIIPLLLIMMILLTSLPEFSEYYESIKAFIFSNLLPVNSEVIMNTMDDFLKNSVKMGIIGFIMILIASLMFFQNFEYIVNKIFHVKKRTFFRSVLMYLTLIFLTPLALGASFYISALIATMLQTNSVTSGIDILPIVPYLLIWGMFFIIFQVVANTKIDPKASLISSFVVSIIFAISKNAYIYYVFYNKSYTTIYGSFSSLMFLFLWIYVSWIIFMYGLKLCYMINRVYQNKDAKHK